MEAEDTARIEQSQRRLEAALAEMRKSCERIKALADSEQRKLCAQKQVFSKVKQRLLDQTRQDSSPKLTLHNALAIQKKLKLEKDKLSCVNRRFAQVKSEQQLLLERISAEQAKLEKHQGLLAGARKIAASRSEHKQAEVLLESRAVFMQSTDSTETKPAWKSEESEVEVVGEGHAIGSQPISMDGLLQLGVAWGSSDSQGGFREGHTATSSQEQQDAGPTHSSPQSSFSQISSLQELKARIQAVCAWEEESSSGVVLDYITSLGRKLQLRICRNGVGSVKIEITPEYQRDSRVVWQDKKKIAEALEECGLTVSEIRVSAAGVG
ncbi:MAG: hypothetical protein GX589_04515 [Deltaproteobacteria bacterium]|nr:hypothetical protein [Deltaproteobacteria bacterium]